MNAVSDPIWWLTKDGDATCFALYSRHYSSRKRPRGACQRQFVGPGESIVLRTDAGDAVFVWRRYIDDTIPKQDGVEVQPVPQRRADPLVGAYPTG